MTYSQLNSIPHRGSPYEGTGPVATAISIVSRKVATDLGSTDEDRRELDLRSRGKAQFLWTRTQALRWRESCKTLVTTPSLSRIWSSWRKRWRR